MPPLNFYDYPGYAEAVEKETSLRVEGFVRTEQKLCGLKVKPMTLRHLILLDGVGSPFVTGSECYAAHIPQFLWTVSLSFRPLKLGCLKNWRTRSRRKRLTKYCRKLDSAKAISDIHEYVEKAFWDAPGGGKKERAPWVGWPTMITHQIGKTYGVPPAGHHLEIILDMPLQIVWQLMRCIQKDANPDSPITNHSDLVVHEHLAKENGEEWPSAKT